MSEAKCAACDRPMTGHSGQTMCRWYGLKLTPALADDCRKFVPAAAPWVCDKQGRGD